MLPTITPLRVSAAWIAQTWLVDALHKVTIQPASNPASDPRSGCWLAWSLGCT
jgi:hypothetical protein